jgi:putative membrane protein
MTADTLKWFMALHFYAFLTWVGSMIGCAFILRAHGAASSGAYSDFVKLEKGVGIAMDVGATIAIIAGLVMLFGLHMLPLKQGGWMHAKLTCVAGLIGIHVVSRIKIRRFRDGDVRPLAAWHIPVLEILVLATIVLAVVRPF